MLAENPQADSILPLKKILHCLDQWAPFAWQESYDNAGLILGDPNQQVRKALVCFDVTPEVVDEAVRSGADLILSHHPAIFKGIKRINPASRLGYMIKQSLCHDIAWCALHTNLDNTLNGVNSYLCEQLGLKDVQPLAPLQDIYGKLQVYVPEAYAEKLRQALAEAGCGTGARYDACSYSSRGEGRFRAGSQAQVKWVRGYVGDVSGEYNGVTTGQSLEDDRTPEQLQEEAVSAAKEADYVIFVGGLNKAHHQDCEDGDRLTYNLPYNQDRLIAALAAVNDHVVVVSISGNAHAMPWLKDVEGILQAWYSGSETGNAMADILFGDVNPSGKLPYTIQYELSDYPAHQYGEMGYPGVDKQVHYMEDIFVGYRYADLYGRRRPIKYESQGVKYTITPPAHAALFPFGFGLSYTQFTYGKAVLDGNKVSISVTNTGKRKGKEVVQLYIADKKASVVRPLKELKGFKKIELEPGETKQVSFEITPDMLAFFDADAHEWRHEPGEFTLMIGSSSADIHAKVNYKVH